MTDKFWEIGKKYKHMSYPGQLFELTGFTKTHAILQGRMQFLVPKSIRHMFMYRATKE